MTISLTALTKHQWSKTLKVVGWLVVSAACAGATALIAHNTKYLATLPGWNVLGVFIQGLLTNEQTNALNDVPADVKTEVAQVAPTVVNPPNLG